LFDLGDGQPPVPRVAIAVAADLARPAQLVAPALAAVLVGGDDTGCGRHLAARAVRSGQQSSHPPAPPHASCHPPRFLPGAGGSRPCPESLPRFPAGVLPAKPSDRSGDSARGRRLAAALARTADDNAIAVLLDRCQT